MRCVCAPSDSVEHIRNIVGKRFFTIRTLWVRLPRMTALYVANHEHPWTAQRVLLIAQYEKLPDYFTR